MAESAVVRQHLIDPEICIRCNTCEATCPVGAITHDTRNYVVDVAKCNLCVDCIPPCPIGSIDNWRRVPRVRAYSAQVNATLPPWSVAHPFNHLYGPKATDKHVVATVVGNFRVTQVGRE